MFVVCPECQKELIHSATERGYFWVCPACNGRVISLAALRKEAGDDFVQRLTVESRRALGGFGRPCPMCSNYMMKTTMGAGTGAYDLEVCPACQSVWVSAAAYRKLPLGAPPTPQPATPPPSAALTQVAATSWPANPIPAPPIYPAPAAGYPPPPPAAIPPNGAAPGPAAGYPSGRSDRIVLTQEQQDRIATVYAQTVANQMNSRFPTNPSEPEAMWQRIAGYLGMPVIVDANLANKPMVTYILSAVIVVISLFALYATNMRITVANFAFIPAQPFRHLGLTFLTSFLLHGGWVHLLGNIYFLVVFGSCVEDRLGQGRYLALILTAAVVGDTLHAALDPQSAVPLIGASGGIAGLVVFFGLAYPRAKMAFVLLFRRWVRIPALVFVLFWLFSQAMGARSQIMGVGDVAYLAHIGGALVGFIFWLVWRFAKEEDAGAAAGA